MTGGVLLLLLALDAAEPARPAADPPADVVAPRRAVTLLPLVAGRGVTSKQAKGVSAQLRGAVEALDADGALRLLPVTRDDETAVRKCGATDACLVDLAQQRGADLLVSGTVAASKDDQAGLVISARALPGEERFEAILQGNDDDDGALDRLARELTAPDTLRGALRVEGQPGDEVSLDGRRRGTLGQAGSDDDKSLQIDKLREGPHELQVTRPTNKNGVAYEPFTRRVSVRHRETNTIKVTLLPKETTVQLGGDDPSSSSSPPLGPLLTVGAGALLGAGGITFGVLSLMDSIAVEERAERQQLVFPRDQALVERGQALSVVANVFYGAGVVAAGAGAAWWFMGSPTSSEGP